ncbi:glycosyltransferase family 39 protein [Patescibacteria group bacterium]|nr:glycosyltransferase family 39 protein [Patescibacteria group bacterium]
MDRVPRSLTKYLTSNTAGLLLVIILYALFSGLVLNSLYPFHLATESLLVLTILGIAWQIPLWLSYILGFINLLLLWLIVKKVFGYRVALFCSLTYATSPWISYLVVGDSLTTWLLTIWLIIFYGLFCLSHSFWKIIFLIAGCIMLIFSSVLMWPALCVLLVTLYIKKNSSFLTIQNFHLLTAVSLLTFMALLLTNYSMVKHSLGSQLLIIQNISIVNTVNLLRGEDNQAGIGKLGFILDNKYAYGALYFSSRLLENINPVNYFVSSTNFIRQSNTPPILFGWIIPLILGIGVWQKVWKMTRWSVVFVLCLLTPSLVSSDGFSINKIGFVSPLLFVTCGVGLERLLSLNKYRIWFALIIIAILIQLVFVANDVTLRENVRLDYLRFAQISEN